MDVLVPPNGTSQGFAINDRNCGYQFGNYHHDDSHIVSEIGNNSRAVLGEIGNASRASIKETSDVGRTLASDICKTGHDGVQATHASAAETRAAGAAHREADERFHLAAREAISDGFTASQVQLERGVGEIRRDNLVSFASLDKFMCDKFAMVDRNVATGFASAQLFAAQNHAESLRELLKCCCETHKEIAAMEGKIISKMCDTENRQLRDELAAAKQAALLAQLVGAGSGPGNSFK
jgi:hypothetical protein